MSISHATTICVMVICVRPAFTFALCATANPAHTLSVTMNVWPRKIPNRRAEADIVTPTNGRRKVRADAGSRLSMILHARG